MMKLDPWNISFIYTQYPNILKLKWLMICDLPIRVYECVSTHKNQPNCQRNTLESERVRKSRFQKNERTKKQFSKNYIKWFAVCYTEKKNLTDSTVSWTNNHQGAEYTLYSITCITFYRLILVRFFFCWPFNSFVHWLIWWYFHVLFSYRYASLSIIFQQSCASILLVRSFVQSHSLLKKTNPKNQHHHIRRSEYTLSKH